MKFRNSSSKYFVEKSLFEIFVETNWKKMIFDQIGTRDIGQGEISTTVDIYVQHHLTQ